MGLLYPRLLGEEATLLFEKYLGSEPAELSSYADTSNPAAVFVATGGDRVPENRLKELQQHVVDIAKDAGFPSAATRGRHAEFDLRVAETLHREMGIVPAEAASGDIWAFLALVLLPDVAFWRYQKNRERFLNSDITRHVFGRLWWRAQLVYSPEDSNPYAALRILGEAAFDQIYARRQALGGSPFLVKGILDVWSALDLPGLDERDVLRDFLMRLLRLAPFIVFESMNVQTLRAELRSVAEESIAAMRRSSSQDSMGVPATMPSKRVRIMVERGMTDPSDTADAPTASVPQGGPAPYPTYAGPGFGDPRDLGLVPLADTITVVVQTEGPVKAGRVYRVVADLGRALLTEELMRSFVNATKYAVRTGLLKAEFPRGGADIAAATLRTAEQPLCLLRERGPRDPDEIPERELAKVAQHVQIVGGSLADPEDLVRRASSYFGFGRVTDRFRTVLFDALRKINK